MIALTTYAIKSAICLVLLYVPYVLIMKKDTFFSFNRYVLLSIVAMSFVLPLLNIPLLAGLFNPESPDSSTFVDIELPLPTQVEAEKSGRHFSWMQRVVIVYFIGMAICLRRKIVGLIKLIRFIPHGCLFIDKRDGMKIFCHIKDTRSFCWMKSVTISVDDYKNNQREILMHEKAHIQDRHSYDIIFINLAEVIQWFNPFIYLLHSSLSETHEFAADEYVLRNGITAQNYQYLLIRKTIDNGYFPFANSFNHSLLKKRIKMMKTKKSNPWNRMKVLYLIPVSCLVLSVFATPTITETHDEILSSANDNKDEIFNVCEVMPEFEGGLSELMTFLRQNIKYPVSAHKEKIEGRVLVSFVVDKDGSICEANVVKSISPDLDAEALRVVNAMPKWRPGRQNGKVVRVRYILPISFRLTEDNNNVSTKDEGGLSVRLYPNDPNAKTPLVIVDGKEIPMSKLQSIDKNTIDHIDVLNSKSSYKLYGDKAKNGVIIITTKSK